LGGVGGGGGGWLGFNTYSLRSLTQNEAIPVVIELMKQVRLEDCTLISSHVEPARFSPVTPVATTAPRPAPTPEELEARKAMGAALSEWRMKVPLSYFEAVRATFARQGLRIKGYSVRVGSTAEEMDRVFLMAKALGAESINLRVPEAMTAMVAEVADRQRMLVGLQFSDVAVLMKQLPASKYFRMYPDTGDLTRARVDALEFVRTNYEAMSSLDLKDGMLGGRSVPFGEGEAHMKEVVRFLRDKHATVMGYVDCDYPGTGRSTDEVKRCVEYVRGAHG
jgi:hypothetical protein